MGNKGSSTHADKVIPNAVNTNDDSSDADIRDRIDVSTVKPQQIPPTGSEDGSPIQTGKHPTPSGVEYVGEPTPLGRLLQDVDILPWILKHLSIVDILRISRLSKDCYAIVNEASTWRFLCNEKLGLKMTKAESESWKEVFVNAISKYAIGSCMIVRDTYDIMAVARVVAKASNTLICINYEGWSFEAWTMWVDVEKDKDRIFRLDTELLGLGSRGVMKKERFDEALVYVREKMMQTPYETPEGTLISSVWKRTSGSKAAPSIYNEGGDGDAHITVKLQDFLALNSYHIPFVRADVIVEKNIQRAAEAQANLNE
eukprot:Colp12_sorted_trinity150504_noHs@14114